MPYAGPEQGGGFAEAYIYMCLHDMFDVFPSSRWVIGARGLGLIGGGWDALDQKLAGTTRRATSRAAPPGDPRACRAHGAADGAPVFPSGRVVECVPSLGWQRFIRSPKNRFDALVTVATCARSTI